MKVHNNPHVSLEGMHRSLWPVEPPELAYDIARRIGAMALHVRH